jgi:general secretion pathway protein K
MPSNGGRAAGRGSALIAVLWLVAALSAIAFTVASSVHSEVGRVSNSTDGLKAYYLATGAIERALLYLQWGPAYRNPDGTSRYYDGGPIMRFEFPTGRALVEMIPETSKLNVNSALPEELNALVLALGAGPERAREITLGIVDWRTPQLDPSAALSIAGTSSFLPRHASFQEIEELLLVNGMTPELFYGTYERDPQGALVRRHGLADCLSVYGSPGGLDANTADPAVLAAVGIPPDAISAIVQLRQVGPIRMEALSALGQGVPAMGRLGVASGTIFTVRATAQGRLADGTPSDARRSVAVMLKLLDRAKSSEPYHVLRWYDNVWVE